MTTQKQGVRDQIIEITGWHKFEEHHEIPKECCICGEHIDCHWNPDAIIELICAEAQGMKNTVITKSGFCITCTSPTQDCVCDRYNNALDDLCARLKGGKV